MKYFHIILFLIVSFHLFSELSMVDIEAYKCLENTEYDKAITLLDNALKKGDDVISDVVNLLYMLAYWGKEDYDTSYEHILKIEDIEHNPHAKSYIPFLKYKIGKISKKEAKKRYDELILSTGDINYLVMGAYFYALNNYYSDAEKLINKIQAGGDEDSFYLGLLCYISLKRNSNNNKFIELWYDINKVKNNCTYTSFDYAILLNDINDLVKDIHDPLIKSLYFYLKGDKVKSEKFIHILNEQKNEQRMVDFKNKLKISQYAEEIIRIIDNMLNQ